ncbi:hypothetical protein JOL62DRAFT_100105 [Phyllosticta paracitricarpa]|uniref:Uncharacterized protein n=1 Tax=Phyllosticta paracitricarpa TaxID=2016321 RepID=A0ABR1N8Z4_9PEZI
MCVRPAPCQQGVQSSSSQPSPYSTPCLDTTRLDDDGKKNLSRGSSLVTRHGAFLLPSILFINFCLRTQPILAAQARPASRPDEMRCEIVASAVPSSFLLVSLLLLLLLLHQRVASSEAGMLLPSPERAVKKTPQQDKCTLPTPTPTPLLRDVSRCCADCGVRAYVHTDSGQAGRQAGKQIGHLGGR